MNVYLPVVCGAAETAFDGRALDLCLSKRAYATEDEAWRVARAVNRKRPGTGTNCPYRCHFNPKHWHIGRPGHYQEREGLA